MIGRITITLVAVVVALVCGATYAASSTGSNSAPVQPQPQTVRTGNGPFFSLDARSAPQDHSEPLGMFLSEGQGATSFGFVGTYLVTAHVYGRYRNVTPGGSRLLIELSDNSVSDDAGFPEVASADWRFFNQVIVGETTVQEPGEWAVRVDLADGEIEILNVSVVATHAPSIS